MEEFIVRFPNGYTGETQWLKSRQRICWLFSSLFYYCQGLVFYWHFSLLRTFFYNYVTTLDYILLWLGISIAANAVPGSQEIEYTKNLVKHHSNKTLCLLRPIFWLMSFLLILRSLCFEFLYGGLIAFLVPYWIWGALV